MRRDSQRGFTLVELMVVLVIVSVLIVGATVMVNPSKKAKTTQAFADEIATVFDLARLRAGGTQKFSRISFDTENGVIEVWQAVDEGLNRPVDVDGEDWRDSDDWVQRETLTVPDDVELYAYEAAARPDSGKVFAEEDVGGFDAADLVFSPDGTALSGTVYLQNTAETQQYRVTLFGITGSTFTFSEW